MDGSPEMSEPRVSLTDPSLRIQPHGFRYTAFISYRHIEPDQKWAIPGASLSETFPLYLVFW